MHDCEGHRLRIEILESKVDFLTEKLAYSDKKIEALVRAFELGVELNKEAVDLLVEARREQRGQLAKRIRPRSPRSTPTTEGSSHAKK